MSALSKLPLDPRQDLHPLWAAQHPVDHQLPAGHNAQREESHQRKKDIASVRLKDIESPLFEGNIAAGGL
ncbi:hypothetical protein LSM04_006103 [Trypanosoma melophagium]|uniref:uncharacterized protein n=1 Tax=Trypanosoma melophagium TaxID=715481 RepID=UPI00351A7D99|nr:hypothetical protein LSM04_006103 [Trypanosoma melophagium]